MPIFEIKVQVSLHGTAYVEASDAETCRTAALDGDYDEELYGEFIGDIWDRHVESVEMKKDL
jgi:hypothetical protein